MVERDPAGLRQMQSPTATLEEGMTDLLLELSDLHRQRRLGQIQPLGGACEIAVMGDEPEIAQVIVVQSAHDRSIITNDRCETMHFISRSSTAISHCNLFEAVAEGALPCPLISCRSRPPCPF